MSTASNLYASRVFSEHPIITFPLDDDISYLSLISETDRNLSLWTQTNGLSFSASPIGSIPFLDSIVTGISASSSSLEFQAISPPLFKFLDLNASMNTFSINMYLYTESSVLYYEYGYRYLDPYLGEYVEDTRNVVNNQFGRWIRLGSTFNPPNYSEDVDIELIFRVKFVHPSGGPWQVLMNGLSVGQWSEKTNSTSLGVDSSSLPTELHSLLGSSAIAGVPINAYGISSEIGYTLENNNRLLAVNSGIPMVYGSDNVTKLYPSNQYFGNKYMPSIVLPGGGALNELSRYFNYTVEMWLRIENNSKESRRIWGPLDSDYGIYVKDGTIALVVGDAIGTYFVSDWYRPMLIHVIFKNNEADMLINGSPVISILYNDEDIVLPDINKDWVGYYCYDNMPIFEIDCYSVFPYIIPAQVAKRRFVWGQGVENPETINSAFEGTVAYIDYPFANYTMNRNYPDLTKWDAGYFENLLSDRFSVSPPAYELPEIFLSGRDVNDWYQDCLVYYNEEYPSKSASVVSALSASPSIGSVTYFTSASHGFVTGDVVTVTGSLISDYNTSSTIYNISASNSFTIKNNATLPTQFVDGLAVRDHPYFISFRPNTTWEDTPCYFLFNNINILTEPLSGVYGMFEIEQPTTSKEPLIHFVNTLNKNTFNIDINGTLVTYELSMNGTTTLYHSFNVQTEKHFAVGFDISRMFSYYGKDIIDFFGNTSAIQAYVGGDSVNTFSGIIYRVGFSNQSNINEISTGSTETGHFDSRGIAASSDASLLNDHLASYTLTPVYEYGRYYLDISIHSYWQEYYPLSYFASYVDNIYGKKYYDVDFIQYNIGYPTISEVVQDIVVGSWTYDDLYQAYSNPQKTYEVLDNSFITGYQNYNALQNNAISISNYNFDKSSVRSYVTFDKIVDGANTPLSNYTDLYKLPSTEVIDVESITGYMNKKFEIKDNCVIYPPKKIPIDQMAIVLHLDINIRGIKSNPVRVRRMSLSSKALNDNDFNPVGTRFGVPLYPYKKSAQSNYYDTKSNNPYSIYKESNPYLYLTKNSGIRSLGLREYQIERGISMPINSENISPFKVNALQIWLKYSEEIFPQVAIPIFNLLSRNLSINFNIVTDQSSTRSKIYSSDALTGQDYTALTFYQDGIQVINPYIEKDVWTCIGVAFEKPIDFSNYNGSLNLFQSCVFNNISFYKSSALQEVQSIIYRKWERVKQDPLEVDPNEWIYWKTNEDGDPQEWDRVLKISESSIYGVSPSELYKTYSGTNRYIVDDGDGFTINDSGVSVLSSRVSNQSGYVLVDESPEWSTFTRKPV